MGQKTSWPIYLLQLAVCLWKTDLMMLDLSEQAHWTEVLWGEGYICWTFASLRGYT